MGIPATPPNVPAPPAGDKANLVWSDLSTGNAAITGTGRTPAIEIFGVFNACLYGPAGPNGNWNATIRLERSFDGGTTWLVCGVGGGGQQAIYNTPNQDVSLIVGEPEKGVLYAWNCTLYTSGTIHWRFSTTGAAAMTLGLAPAI